MYHRFCLNLYKPSLYRTSNGIRFQVNRLNHVIHKNEERQKVEVISKFPDYKIIYTFPYISYISSINAMKKQFTIFIGLAIPLTIQLQLANTVPANIAIGSLLSGMMFTLWLHNFGLCCNNFVGHIYFKQDESKVIFSYVDYWGKRIDLETTVNDIVPMTEQPRRFTDYFFKKITFFSKRKALKINMKYGQILDNNFTYILG